MIATAADFHALLPPVSSSSQDSYLLAQILEPPYEADFDCEVTLRPGTAASWSFSPDGKELAVTLRDDLRWSDGTPITARDHA